MRRKMKVNVGKSKVMVHDKSQKRETNEFDFERRSTRRGRCF